MTDATSGAGNAYHSGAPKYIPGVSGVRVARSVVFYVFVPLFCLSFFDLRILIIPFVSSNFSQDEFIPKTTYVKISKLGILLFQRDGIAYGYLD
jgi:hypothetical protein